MKTTPLLISHWKTTFHTHPLVSSSVRAFLASTSPSLIYPLISSPTPASSRSSTLSPSSRPQRALPRAASCFRRGPGYRYRPWPDATPPLRDWYPLPTEGASPACRRGLDGPMRLAQDSGAGRDAMLRMLRPLISVVTLPSKVVSSVLREREREKKTFSVNMKSNLTCSLF